jgi:hypothetical protein
MCSHTDPLVKYHDPSVPFCFNCPIGTTPVYDHCKTLMAGGALETPLLPSLVRELAQAGGGKFFDPLENLAARDPATGKPTHRVWLYRGQFDRTYLPGSVRDTGRFFAAFGAAVDESMVDTVPSQHAWPTVSSGTPCGLGGAIESCGVDGTGAALQSLYSDLKLNAPAATINAAGLQPFDQTPYFGIDPLATQLADTGYLYIPKACQANTTACDLHIALHGCNVDKYYESAVHDLSLNRWGETNSIVVLWPRIQPRNDSAATVQQRQGCFDAYAQTGEFYMTKAGPQMAAIGQMMSDIHGQRAAAWM